MSKTMSKREIQARAERIVTLWQNGTSKEDICSQLGMSEKSLSIFVANARKKGVPLRKRVSRGFDWNKLKALAERPPQL